MWAEFSSDGRSIVTASHDGTVILWKADQAIAPILKGHTNEVRSAEFSPDGTRVVTASDTAGCIWDVAAGTVAATLSDPGRMWEVTSAAFSHDGSRVVTGSGLDVRIWKAGDGSAGPVRRAGFLVDRVAFSPDGRDVVIQGPRRSEVWHLEGASPVRREEDGGLLMAVGPEDLRLVSYQEAAKVWKADGTLLAELPFGEEGLERAAFSPKGGRLVLFTAAGDAEVRTIQGALVRKKIQGALVKTLKGWSKFAWSPDGQRLAVDSGDHSVNVWNVEDERLLPMKFKGHGDSINSIQFSPGGERLVTASDDRTVRLWDTEQENLIAVIRGHGAEVNSASFSSDGKRLVTASNDGTAKVWTVDAEMLRRQFWFATSFCLSPSERSLSLGETDANANQGYADCQTMSRCLRDDRGLVLPDKYEGCLARFREAQAQRYSSR
jgi:WD40 repeat protein